VGCYKGVIRVLQGCYKGVTRVLRGYYRNVKRVIEFPCVLYLTVASGVVSRVHRFIENKMSAGEGKVCRVSRVRRTCMCRVSRVKRACLLPWPSVANSNTTMSALVQGRGSIGSNKHTNISCDGHL
jgi:hypothetical protein